MAKKLFTGRFFGSEFNSHNIGNDSQSSGDDQQSIGNLGTSENSVKLLSSHNCENLSSNTAISKEIIANASTFINLTVSRLMKPGAITNRPIQPAQRLPKIPESTLKNDFLTRFTLAKIGMSYNNIEFGRKAN